MKQQFPDWLETQEGMIVEIILRQVDHVVTLIGIAPCWSRGKEATLPDPDSTKNPGFLSPRMQPTESACVCKGERAATDGDCSQFRSA